MLQKRTENVDRGILFAYNRSMGEKGKQNKIRTVLRVLLPIACLLWLTFILMNSLQTGEQSSAQSATVVKTVQQVAKVIAPESAIANATGAAYDKLHNFVRSFAHFIEFAVLGVLFGWCYFAYTFKRRYLYFPVIGAVLVPVIDECMQSFVSGRGSELFDVAVDTCGGLAGILFAALSVVIGALIYERRLRERADNGTEENVDKNKLKPPKGHPMYRNK